MNKTISQVMQETLADIITSEDYKKCDKHDKVVIASTLSLVAHHLTDDPKEAMAHTVCISLMLSKY